MGELILDTVKNTGVVPYDCLFKSASRTVPASVFNVFNGFETKFNLSKHLPFS